MSFLGQYPFRVATVVFYDPLRRPTDMMKALVRLWVSSGYYRRIIISVLCYLRSYNRASVSICYCWYNTRSIIGIGTDGHVIFTLQKHGMVRN